MKWKTVYLYYLKILKLYIKVAKCWSSLKILLLIENVELESHLSKV